MKYINILLATLLCVSFAPAVQAQRLPVKPLKMKVYKLGKMPKGVVPGFKVQVPLVNPQFKAKVVQLPVAQLKVAVDQKAREIQHQLNQQRAAGITPQQVWIDEVHKYRAELLAAYHLPQNYIEGFYMRRIDPYRSRPEMIYHPEKNSDKVLYRGMIITPEELTAILKKGFSPKDSKWNTGTDERGAAVSLSSSYNEANHYIFQNGYKKDGIGVVFVVKRKPTMELGKSAEFNSTKTIYYSYEDIPASDILDVYIHGEYGPESLSQIVEKINAGTLRPHTTWTDQFNGSGFLR